MSAGRRVDVQTAMTRAGRGDLIGLLRAVSGGRAGLSGAALDEASVRWAVETGLGPLLMWAVTRDPHAARPPCWPLLRAADLTARVLTAQQHTAMTDIIDACAGRVPPLVLLKGVSIADEHYPEPHLRPMRDVDVFIEADAVACVESVLGDLGYRRYAGKPLAFYDTHHHGSPFHHPDTGVWVEIHHALVPPSSEMGADRAFHAATVETQLRASEFRGRAVRRLSDELQMVYLACHWARGLRVVGGMVAMVDMTFLLKHRAAVDWARVLAWTERSASARHLAVLMTYLDRHGVIDVAPEIRQRLAQSHRRGRLVQAIACSLLDRYVVAHPRFGRLMSERTFNRVWRLVVSRRPRSPTLPAGRAPAEKGAGAARGRGEGGTTMSEDAAVNRVSSAAATPRGHYPTRRRTLRVQVVAGEAVVLDRQHRLVHQLNETASYIWDRCDGRHTVTQIADDLARAFDVDRDTARRDVATAVQQLEATGLVHMLGRSMTPSGRREVSR